MKRVSHIRNSSSVRASLVFERLSTKPARVPSRSSSSEAELFEGSRLLIERGAERGLHRVDVAVDNKEPEAELGLVGEVGVPVAGHLTVLGRHVSDLLLGGDELVAAPAAGHAVLLDES